ncbi:MAG: hypothetical protein AB1571_03830 [Nanoarchaeota archaeon]
MKKSQIQFNWIFVIVAGAIILAFFINFGMKYIELQNKKLGVEVARGIENELDNLKTVQLYTELPLGINTKIEFNCDNFKVNDYASKGLSDKIIASDKVIETKDLLLWTQEVYMPFKIGNIFYVADAKRKYIFVYDSNSFEFVKGLEIPEIFNIEKTDEEAGNAIYFTDSDDGVVIKGREKGIVKVNGKEYPYFNLPMLYAAIFSSDYECILDKVIEKTGEMAELYGNKALYIKQQGCSYIGIKSTLDKLRDAVRKRDYGKISDLTEQIGQQNKELYNKGCIPVF